MSEFLPIVDQLAECLTDSDRARWLLACPLDLLKTYRQQVRLTLGKAGFFGGVRYVDLETVALSSVRDQFGEYPTETKEMLLEARNRLWLIAQQ